MKSNLALFDFDGTISKTNSMIEFLKFYKGSQKLILAFVKHTHWIILMYLGIVAKWRVKEKIWISLFSNTHLETFNEVSTSFSLEILPSILYKSAVNQIKQHKINHDRIVVVSASAENWLKPWCDMQQIELISTRLEVKNGVVTGKIDGKNCNGKEKAKRIKQAINLNEYDSIYAYGDSAGDKQMLALATYTYYKNFK
jgi:phosphatidylglycerophosphatase C